ncbi:NUDIX hydrolase [Streptomyces himalayensis]|uniref:NUDIX domain-containing protein n=1 Tax=Streptomyces himalayensis subsp. himalayensis TaxID=2756131 RepID=A0A7W0DUP6_9ACTN|nr:NUDIX domain-containing protein [Streptomyces himalayensis]MBA2951616.1 NUDIX domain-containing protein [Streptomyces himalayensis subsp. himalayensis]
MDVVDTWTGRTACALQAAFRDTNEAFAGRLDVAPRTVANWHKDPELVPRTELQAALDTTYERAGEAVRRRFSLLARPPEERINAQALRVAIAVVVRGEEVLLVCRRGDESLRWQFPAGVVKPGAAAEAVTVQETHAETGVHCAVREHLGSRLHPLTGVLALYYLCDYLAGEATNNDVLENVDVTWAPIRALSRFIPADTIYPPIMAALEDA